MTEAYMNPMSQEMWTAYAKPEETAAAQAFQMLFMLGILVIAAASQGVI
jgi:hypothetical protein